MERGGKEFLTDVPLIRG